MDKQKGITQWNAMQPYDKWIIYAIKRNEILKKKTINKKFQVLLLLQINKKFSDNDI